MKQQPFSLKQITEKALSAADSVRNRIATAKAEKTVLRAAEQHAPKSTPAFPERQIVDISAASVFRGMVVILGTLSLAWFVVEIRSILILFLIASFLAVIINPLVGFLARYHIPRGLGALITYIVFFTVVSVVISSLIPILTKEIPNLINSVLTWMQRSLEIDTSSFRTQIFEVQNYLLNIQQNLSKEDVQTGFNLLSTVGQNALAVFKTVAGGVFSVVVVLVVAFFMVLEEDGIRRSFLSLFPSRYHDYITDKAQKVYVKFGSWARGVLLLMLIMGTFAYTALSLLGVNYALSLAMLVGLAELIPYVGPLIALIPALIVAASQGGAFLTGIVLALYLVMQWFENNLVVPLIMEKAVGLSPVIIMFAMFVGASFPDLLNPIVGILLAVPLATAISVFVQDYADRKK